jgi:DNA polymerase III alpha subunit
LKHKNGEAKRRRDDERIDQETKMIKPWHFAVLFLILFLFLKNTRKVIYKRGGLFEKN